ncbi:MAG: hydroxyacid dehydrogenase [Thermoplasmata archaeon]|nr:hydroxyacid dehydrogenase [Candidatus Sysuiplasma acidicola]MBX8646331.1 hydroxyacid dehydrogenase [Candidatus Sysuiplasma acidicola]
MTKILITDAVDEKYVRALQSIDGFEVDFRNGITADQLPSIIGDYDCIIVRSRTKLTGKLIGSAQNAKLIVRAGVGTDNIDIAAASGMNIAVANTPWANVVSAAELAFTLMLMISRKAGQANASMHDGKWETLKFTGAEVSEKVLGIIGLGRVGREVARRARAFQMTVIASDPFLRQDVADTVGAKLVSMETLLAESDIISLHASMMAGNVHLIGAGELAKMKHGAILINTARGEMVDTVALVEAVKSGKLAGAGLDVYEGEPAINPALSQLPAVVMTPHIGAQTREAQNRVGKEVVEVVEAFFKRNEMINVVNEGSIRPNGGKVN